MTIINCSGTCSERSFHVHAYFVLQADGSMGFHFFGFALARNYADFETFVINCMDLAQVKCASFIKGR